jgi:hypothetical protein
MGSSTRVASTSMLTAARSRHSSGKSSNSSKFSGRGTRTNTGFHLTIVHNWSCQCLCHDRHPFTITSAPDDSYLSMHIRCRGDWTSSFRAIFSQASWSPSHHGESGKISGALLCENLWMMMANNVVFLVADMQASDERPERPPPGWLHVEKNSLQWFVLLKKRE